MIDWIKDYYEGLSIENKARAQGALAIAIFYVIAKILMAIF